MLRVEVEMDRVVIEGIVIARPVRISRSAWMSYWERVAPRAAG